MKKKQLLVLSLHGVLGRGSHATLESNMQATSIQSDPLKLNMIGNTFLTHFLSCVMPIGIYSDSPEAFYLMLEKLTDDLRTLFFDGLQVGQRKLWVCCLAVKGDAPWLTKAGKFERNFLRRPTRSSSKKPAVGVCFKCLAGKEDWRYEVPFEDLSLHPKWLETVEVVPPHYAGEPSPLLRIPREVDNPNGERFFCYDLFHNWHSGIGKYFLSSAVVILIDLVEEKTIDDQFAALSSDFQRFCKMNRYSPYFLRLTKVMFGVQNSMKDTPSAGWSKGDFTTVLSRWLENWCLRKVLDQDPLYSKVAAQRIVY